MFEGLSTQEWFFVALAAGTGFLVVRHFMDKLSGGAESGARPRQETPEPPPQDKADQSTWFRRDTNPGEDAVHDGFSGTGARTSSDGFQAPPSTTSSMPWHQVLEVSPTAPVADIKSAYKRKIRKYHPDKVAELGPEFTTIAEAKAKEINLAYQQACTARGIADQSP